MGNVLDTQCRFKCMTKCAAQCLYVPLSSLSLAAPLSATPQHTLFLQDKWSHDVEILFRAHSIYHMPSSELDVFWTEKLEGSNLRINTSSPLHVVWISMSMLYDVMQMRLAYAVGQWK